MALLYRYFWYETIKGEYSALGGQLQMLTSRVRGHDLSVISKCHDSALEFW